VGRPAVGEHQHGDVRPLEGEPIARKSSLGPRVLEGDAILRGGPGLPRQLDLRLVISVLAWRRMAKSIRLVPNLPDTPHDGWLVRIAPARRDVNSHTVVISLIRR
jgi:hypothetical protein